MVSSVLIVGASRGIGFALGQRYIQAGWRVITAARTAPEKPIEAPHRHIKCDVLSVDDIESLAKELGDEPLNLLFFVAGIAALPETLESVKPDEMHRVFQTNAFAPFLVTRAVLPNLKRAESAKVIFITSREGSIADNGSGGRYLYRSSKAALHALGKNLSIDLQKLAKPIPVLLLHPGMAETSATRKVIQEMKQRPPGILQPSETAEHLYQRAEELQMGKTGTFMHRDGYELPW